MPLLTRDAALLKSFRQGDRQALAEVYSFYSPRLRRYLNNGFSFESQGRMFRYSGAKSTGIDAEWAVQETFARAFTDKVRARYDGERPFTRYLQTVARNLLLREINRNRRLSPFETETQIEPEFSSASLATRQLHVSPEQAAEGKELQQLLRGIMSDLDAEEMLFVQHRFIDGLTQEATARAMQTTRARIKLLEARLRKLFLKQFRQHGYFVEKAPAPRWKRQQNVA